MSKEVELKENGIVVYIPENTVALSLIAKVYNPDGVNMSVQKDLTVDDIYEARRDYDDNYDDPNARYVITEEGIKYLEELEND